MNRHLIEVRYIPASASKAARISLTSHWDGKRAIKNITGYTETLPITKAILKSMGFTLTCEGPMKRGYFIIVNEFKSLKG